MRYLLLFIFPLLAAFSLKVLNDKYPLIVLEEKHAQGKPGKKVEYYRIKPSKGIQVDPRQINIKANSVYKKLIKDGIPVKIYVIDQGTLYEGPFFSDKIMTLDETHLFNVDGEGKFAGFKSPYAYAIGIGEVRKEHNDQFSVLTAWSTVVKVAE